MKLFSIILGVVLTFVSCNSNTSEKQAVEEISEVSTHNQLQKLNWLIGSWSHTEGSEFSKETWSRVNDSTFTGFSYTQIAQDTVFAETLTLEEKENKLYLTVVAFNQNDNAPVLFTMINAEEGQYTFENPLHDFPERIVYTNPTKDSIHAWIEGRVQGELKQIDFHFKKLDGM